MEHGNLLRNLVDRSVEDLRNLHANDWIEKPDPSKWSKKEILGHLVDSATTNLRRFVVTQYLPEEKIIYHQDEWVQLQHYQEADLGDLIQLWKLLNLQLARVIEKIPEEALQNRCDTGKEATQYHTLEFLIADYLEHLQHHLAQITGNRT